MDLVGNHSILSMILNSMLGTRHLKLDPVAQLCWSFLSDLTPRAPVEVPLQGKWGRRLSPLHREVWSRLGCGNLLPYPIARLKYRKLMLSLIKLKRMNMLACYRHTHPVLFLVR